VAKQPDHCRCRDWVPPRRSEREGFATSNVPNLRGQVTLNGLEVRICLERNAGTLAMLVSTAAVGQDCCGVGCHCCTYAGPMDLRRLFHDGS
jgi:hypothetical protein